MAWSEHTKPTPANIRRRIESAQETINAAMDLAKKHPKLGEPRFLRKLDQAYAWLVDANRAASK